MTDFVEKIKKGKIPVKVLIEEERAEVNALTKLLNRKKKKRGL